MVNLYLCIFVCPNLYIFVCLNLCKANIKNSSNNIDSLKQEQHTMANNTSEKQQDHQQHIMTVVNSQFETMPLGLSQDIPDVRL